MSGWKVRTLPRNLIAILLAGSTAAAAVVLLPGVPALRAAVGVPFLLFGQGYAVMSALFARELPEPSVRVLLALTLSVATIIAVGLVLGAADVPLTGPALVTGVLVVTYVAVAVAVIRQPLEAAPWRKLHAGDVARSRWLWSALIAVAAFALLLVALSRPLPNTRVAGYTELWALRAAGGNVTVGVKSAERSRATYRVVARAASGKTVSMTFTVAPGKQWTQVLAIGYPELQTVDVRLYRVADPNNLYRELTLRA
jgi:uncharacterized membrane protein